MLQGTTWWRRRWGDAGVQDQCPCCRQTWESGLPAGRWLGGYSCTPGSMKSSNTNFSLQWNSCLKHQATAVLREGCLWARVLMFTVQTWRERFQKKGLKCGAVFHKGGLSSGDYHQGDLSSGCSHHRGLSVRWSLIRVVSQDGLSGWTFIRVISSWWSFITVVFHHGGLSSGWSFTDMVSHQGNLSSGWGTFQQGDLSSEWSFTDIVPHQGDLSSGWSFSDMVSHWGDLSSGWSFTDMVSHWGDLSSGWCFISDLSPGWSSNQSGLSSRVPQTLCFVLLFAVSINNHGWIIYIYSKTYTGHFKTKT